MRGNRKDKPSEKSLRALLFRRRQLLRYLKRTEIDAYWRVIKGLNLKDVGAVASAEVL